MRDPGTIEREIEVERAALAKSLEALDDRLSPEALVARASDMLRGGGSAAGGVAKENPLALALIGSGVAWLLASTRDDHAAPRPAPRPARPKRLQTAPAYDPTASAAYDPTASPTTPGLASETPPMAGFDARVAAADRAMRNTEIEGDDTMSTTTVNYDHDTATDTGRRARMRQTAKDMRARLHDGLDSLPDAAKARILSARLSAIEAQASVEAQVARASSSVRQTAMGNPLLVGAVAFGIGAAIAASIPRTSIENRTMGARRDQLLDDADRIFREEASKLRAVAEAAVDEGKSAVEDTLRNGPPSEDNPAERVATAAKSEANRQGVGKVN